MLPLPFLLVANQFSKLIHRVHAFLGNIKSSEYLFGPKRFIHMTGRNRKKLNMERRPNLLKLLLVISII